MLKNPELCDGISHMIDVFEKYGEKHLKLITNEIDRNGAPIDKVRAGYILDECLGIDNKTIENCSIFAQCGGDLENLIQYRRK